MHEAKEGAKMREQNALTAISYCLTCFLKPILIVHIVENILIHLIDVNIKYGIALLVYARF